MKLDEAIKYNIKHTEEFKRNISAAEYNALKLSIEAFNRLKLLRKRRHPIALELLPGETEE